MTPAALREKAPEVKSFIPQCHRRVDLGGAVCREISRQQRYTREHARSLDHGCNVARAKSEPDFYRLTSDVRGREP
jgi:hypothetical protein